MRIDLSAFLTAIRIIDELALLIGRLVRGDGSRTQYFRAISKQTERPANRTLLRVSREFLRL